MDVALLGTVIESSGAIRGARETSQAVEKMNDSVRKGAKTWGDAHGRMGASSKKFTTETVRGQERVKDSTARLASEIKRLGAVYLSFQSILSAGTGVASATREMDALAASLGFATGSVEAAHAEIRFLREEADRLGVSFRGNAATYAEVAASFRNTALEGAAVRDVFLGVTEAQIVLGLNQERIGRAFTALSQIAGKQVLTMEELQGQLAEAIPGALDIMQRALGLTGVELREQIEKRSISAAQAVSAFAAQLQSDFRDNVGPATQTLTAQVNRLMNAIFDLAESIGRSGLIDALAGVVSWLNDAVRTTHDWLIELGLLERQIRDLSDSELKLELATAENDLQRLNDAMAETQRIFAGFRAMTDEQLAQSFGLPLAAVQEPGSRETLALARANNALGLTYTELESEIALAQHRVDELTVALEGQEAAENRLIETRGELNRAIEEGARETVELEKATSSLTLKEQGIAAEYERMARTRQAPYLETQQAIEETSQLAEAEAQRVEQAYVSAGLSVADALVGIATGATGSIERIIATLLSSISRAVAAVQTAGGGGFLGYGVGGTTVGGILGGAATGGIIGAGYAGMPGAIGGAIGGGLGHLGGSALASSIGGAITSTLGSSLAAAFTAVAPVIGTAIGGIIGSILGGLIGGGRRQETPELYFIQRRPEQTPYSTPSAQTPFGNLQTYALDDNDIQITQEVWENIQQIVDALALMDEALSEAFGPEQTEQVRQALEGFHIGDDIDELDIPGVVRRRIEIIFGAVSNELVEAFDMLTEGADIQEMVNTAILIGNIYASFEQGNVVFADTATVLETINALVDQFQQQGEELGETLARVLAGMVLVNELRDDNVEASTSFARTGEMFVEALGGMQAAISQTERFISIYSQTQSGLAVALENATESAQDALGAIGLEFDPAAPIALDEFNQAFLEVQNSLSGAELAAWVEAGLALADFMAVYEQIPRAAEEATEAIEDFSDEIASIMQPVLDSLSTRGLSELEIQQQRIIQRRDEMIAQLTAMGASEEDLALIRLEAQLALQDLEDQELERLDSVQQAITETFVTIDAVVARSVDLLRRFSLGGEGGGLDLENPLIPGLRPGSGEPGRLGPLTPEFTDAALAAQREEVRSFFQGIQNSVAQANLPALEYQFRILNQQYAEQARQLMELGGSEEDFRLLRSLYQAQLDNIIEAEAQRIQLEQDRLQAEEEARRGSIDAILSQWDDAVAIIGMTDLDRALFQLDRNAERAIAELNRLGATEEEIAAIRASSTAQSEALIQAEEERNAQLEEDIRNAELDEIADIIADISRGFEVMGLEGLELELFRIQEQTQATADRLIALGATEQELAQAYAYGQALMQRARESALQAELDLIDQISDRINSALMGLAERIRMDISTEEDNYQRLRAQAEALAASLAVMTDPAEIEQTVREIERLTGQAWGLLSTAEQQGAAGRGFIDFLTETEQLAQDRLEVARTMETAAQTIDEAFTEFMLEVQLFGPAVDTFDSAVDAFREGASLFEGAARRMETQSRDRPVAGFSAPQGVVNA